MENNKKEAEIVMAKEPVGYHTENAIRPKVSTVRHDSMSLETVKRINEWKLYPEERDIVLSLVIEGLSIKYGTANYEQVYKGIASTIDTKHIEKEKYVERYELLQNAEYLKDISKETILYIDNRFIKEKLPTNEFHDRSRNLVSNLLFEIRPYYRIITLNKLLELPKKENNSYENYEFINNFLKEHGRR